MEKSVKDKLIETALEKFSSGGFDGTSTREIVKEAGVNISAITYYFGSKEGLYQACMDYILDFIKVSLNENVFKNIPYIYKSELKKEEYKAILFKMLSNAVAFVCGDKIPAYIVSLVIREQIYPSSNFDNVYNKAIKPMHETLTFLFAKASGQDPDDIKVIMETHSIFGQIFIFRTHSDIIKKRINEKNIDKKIEEITDIIIKHTNAILNIYNNDDGEQK